jgi:hypothetical protein
MAMRIRSSHAYAPLLADVTVLQKTHLGAWPATNPVPRAKELIRRVMQEPSIWRDLIRDVADPEAALGVVVWACVRGADDDATGVAALRSQPLPSLAAHPEPPETPRDGPATGR